MQVLRSVLSAISSLFTTGAGMVLFCLPCLGQGTFQIKITFDGPPPQAPGMQSGVPSYYESGMLFQPIPPDTVITRNGARLFPDWPDNGTAYIRETYLGFNYWDGSLFGLVSVDLAGYSRFVPPGYTVQFIGFRADSTSVTTSFSGAGLDFNTFYFGPEFSSLTHVQVLPGPWSMDNLVVAIPEPGAWALLLLGVGIGGVRLLARKRR